jgi:hypothetical protein
MIYKLTALLTAVAALFAPLALPTLAQQPTPVLMAQILMAQRQTEQNLTPAQRSAIEQAISKAVAIPGKPKPAIKKLKIEGRYGLATWSMGHAGGMVALLKTDPAKADSWKIYRLGGGLPPAEVVSSRAGIPVAVARRLLERLNERD